MHGRQADPERWNRARIGLEIEVEQMNRGSSFVMTSTLGIAVVLLMGAPPRNQRATEDAAKQTDGAFCDGVFQAQLDAESGKEPRIQSGRWSTNGDRALFIAGYQHEYRQFATDRPGRLRPLDAAELAGYRDGILDGERHHNLMQAFRVSQTEKYLNAGQDAGANAVSETYQRDYRLGYANGSQVGYYSEASKEESSIASGKLGSM
jgi:hypothetical protein